MNNKFVGFAALKAAVTIEQVLERYGLLTSLRRSGDSLSGPCPLHGGHNATQFRVSLSKNCFNCFGDCHRGGSIVDFVSLKERVGIRDAALLLQDWFHVQPNRSNVQQRPPANGESRAEPGENQPLGFTLDDLDWKHPYLKERGLNDESMRVFRLGYCRHGLLAGRIAIPIHNAHGELIAYCGRWPGEPPAPEPKYKLPRGFRKSLELFNLHRAKEADARLPLVVVDGFFDCIKVRQAGHRRVVSLMGSTLSAAQQELIERTVGPGGRVVILFDEDDAWRKCRAEARERLSELLEVRVVRFGLEGQQPDNIVPERLLELIQHAASSAEEEPCPA